MQSRLLKGFSLVELCFAIIILGISISAVLPISKVALSAKNSQESLQALVAQKQILATRLKERSGGIGKDSEFCDKYGFGCFDKSPKAPQIQSDTLNLTLPVAPKNFYMAENIKFYSLKKPGFSLVELCVAILVFGVVARAIFYSNTLSYELLNSALKSQKLQSLNSAINIISAYYRSHIAQSVLSSEDKLLWVSANEYAQSSYLSLVDMSRSNREKIITKFKPSNILEAFSQSAGVDFASEFKVVAIFNGVSYNTSDFGYFGDNSLALVRASGDDILQIKPGYKGQISGAYTLASSAYALSFDKDSGAIWLYHDWHPWLDESLISAPKALIIDGLSGAKFSISEAGTEIELCIDEICAKEILL